MNKPTNTSPETTIDLTRFNSPLDFGSTFKEHPHTRADTILSMADPNDPDEVAELMQLVEDEPEYKEEVGQIVEAAIRMYAMQRHPSYLGNLALQKEAQQVYVPEKMEEFGYVEDAPLIQDQILDITRTVTFRSSGLKPHSGSIEDGAVEISEIDGLRDLREFLREFLRNSDAIDNTFGQRDEAMMQAKSILDELTFIGSNEFNESARGLALYWKGHLDADPANRLCIITDISDSEKYKGVRKSDEHLKTSILEHFSQSELEEYGDRLVFDTDGLKNSDPDKTKIILLDDWALSGQQMFRVLEGLYDNPKVDEYHDSIEANFIVATEDRIQNGIKDPEGQNPVLIPVKSYFKAHPSSSAEYGARISGLHCTTNFDFGNELWRLSDLLNKSGVHHVDTPALASVVREYRSEPQMARL